MKDRLYTQLKKHYDDTLSLEPTAFNNRYITQLYKAMSPYVKHLPFRVFIPVSLIMSMLLYITLSLITVQIVSLFQHGF